MELKAGYESSNLVYFTGSFSGEEVFGAAATGSYGVVGDPTFDEVALTKLLMPPQKISQENLNKMWCGKSVGFRC